MSTMNDVAELAGVSTATVSRVLSGGGASEDKRRAVLAAAKKLKYSPNRAARSLRKRASEVIALIIPDIGNPNFTVLARGVADAANKAGYSVVLCNTDSQPDKEIAFLDIADSEQMAGIILAASSPKPDLDAILASGRPVVAIDREIAYDIDAVVMPNRAAGATATEALYEAGFRRIACITGPRTFSTAHDRAQGWRDVMLAHDIGDDLQPLLHYSSFDVDGGRESMEALLALPHPPEAVVAGNSLLGIGAIQMLSEHGLVPPDFGVSIIGSLQFSTLPPGAVTVVRLPSRQMGLIAAEMLLERISGDDQPARTVVLRDVVEPATPPRLKASPIIMA